MECKYLNTRLHLQMKFCKNITPNVLLLILAKYCIDKCKDNEYIIV